MTTKFNQLLISIIATISVCILVMILFIINKKNYIQIQIDEFGFKDNQIVYYYQDIEAVIYDLKQIIIYYPACTLTFPYNQTVIDILINHGVQIRNNRRASIIVLVIGYFLGIYFFYQLFVLIIGGIYCLNYGYQVINYLGLLIRIVKIVSIIIAIPMLKKFQNKQLVLLLSIIVFGVSLVSGWLCKTEYYQDSHGSFLCILENDDLKIYKDIIDEFGCFDKRIKNVQTYQVEQLTDQEKAILYVTDNRVGQYLVNSHRNSSQEAKHILSDYEGDAYINRGQMEIEFKDAKIIFNGDDSVMYNRMRLVNDYILELYYHDDLVGNLIFYHYRQKDNNLITYDQNNAYNFVLALIDENKYLKSEFYLKKETTQPDNEQETEITPPAKVEDVPTLLNKMNDIINNGIDNFTSNEEFVRIEMESDNYNEIVREIAKEFTIIHNDNKKIDTQITNITVTAGDLNEFGVRVAERQDIQGEEKRRNHYKYRIKKVGKYYLAMRVSEQCDVNSGLTILEQPIITDTSMTTDFLYRIDGKKYLGNKWG